METNDLLVDDDKNDEGCGCGAFVDVDNGFVVRILLDVKHLCGDEEV